MLTDERIDVATRDPHGLSESQGRPEGPYEHPALEPEVGYWAGRWAEFKRLLLRSLKRDAGTYAVIGAVLIVTLFGMQFFGWR